MVPSLENSHLSKTVRSGGIRIKTEFSQTENLWLNAKNWFWSSSNVGGFQRWKRHYSSHVPPCFLISGDSVCSNIAPLSTFPPLPSITQVTIALLMQPSISITGWVFVGVGGWRADELREVIKHQFFFLSSDVQDFPRILFSHLFSLMGATTCPSINPGPVTSRSHPG